MTTTMGHRGLIFQCGACRALVSSTNITLDAAKERAGLTCDACGGINYLPLSTAAGGSARGRVDVVDIEPAAGVPSAMPTLSANASGASSTALAPMAPVAVAAPGLSVEQRDAIAQKLAALPAPEGERQRELAEGFDRLLGQWHVENEHKAYLKRASMAGELAFAGQRYRLILDAAPGNEPAKRAQNEILSLAMVTMNTQRDLGAVADDGKKKNAALIAIVLGVALAATLFWLLPRLLRDLSGGDTMDIDGVERVDQPGRPDGQPDDGAGGFGERRVR